MRYKKLGLLFSVLFLRIGILHGQNPVLNSIPLKNLLASSSNKTSITRFLNPKIWNTLFPHRYGIGIKDSIHHNPDFYSFKAFVKAAKLFPSFLGEGTEDSKRRELAAFLANIAQETSGGWKEAPGGYFKWGLYYLEEKQGINKSQYIDTIWKKYLPYPGKYYFGRGPKQFSWNYNYGQFSEAWYGSQDTLLKYPERLAQDPVLSFASAIWFWMSPQKPKPSCHDIMIGNWIPNEMDLQKNRKAGFGATVNVINGGVECGLGSSQGQTAYRYAYYRYFCEFFKVEPGENIDCDHQTAFGK